MSAAELLWVEPSLQMAFFRMHGRLGAGFLISRKEGGAPVVNTV